MGYNFKKQIGLILKKKFVAEKVVDQAMGGPATMAQRKKTTGDLPNIKTRQEIGSQVVFA